MSEMYAISRIAKYKFSDCGGVLKEALRVLPNYDNPDCDPSKSYLNVPLIECDLQGLTPEKYILKYREDNNIKGRFNTANSTNAKNLTNVMCQCLFTASKDFMDKLSCEEQIQYFRDCLEFFKQEFPSVPILSAIIHFDETTPHMHITYLPIVERENKRKKCMESVFSTTLLMPGKEFLPQYQDRFFRYISEKYDNVFDRGKSSRKNMSVKQFKEYKELEARYDDLSLAIAEYKRTIYNQRQKIASLHAELREVYRERERENILTSIPLIGKLIKLLLDLNYETQVKILEKAIDNAYDEKSRLRITLDEQISSTGKQRILDAVFGKRDIGRDR